MILNKRFGFAAVLLALALAVSASAVGASTRSVNLSLTGTSNWTPADFGTVSSFAIQGTFDDTLGQGSRLHSGSYSGTLTAGTYGSPAACPDFSPNSYNAAPVSGTITLVTKSGTITTAVQPGGLVCNSTTGRGLEAAVFDLTLEVMGGMKAYAGATGILALHYSSEWIFPLFAPPEQQDFGTLTGTIVR